MKSSRQGARERACGQGPQVLHLQELQNHLPGAGGQGEHRHHLSQMRAQNPGQDVTMALRFASAGGVPPPCWPIYGQYLDTPVTFEAGPSSEAEFARRIRLVRRHATPYLVWEEGGRPCRLRLRPTSWGSGRPISGARSCPSIWTGLDQPGGSGGGSGGALLELLRLQGVRDSLRVRHGAQSRPARGSTAPWASGRRASGAVPGFKCGAWRDVAWFEKPLASYEPDPGPLLAHWGSPLRRSGRPFWPRYSE